MVLIELACESCEVAVLSFVLVAPSCTAGCARYLGVPAAGDHFLNWTFSGGAGFSPFDERASGGSTSAMLVLLYASACGSQLIRLELHARVISPGRCVGTRQRCPERSPEASSSDRLFCAGTRPTRR